MKVLMYLQLSRKLNDKYLLTADSNFNFMKYVVNSFDDLNHDVTVIVPHNHQKIESVHSEFNDNVNIQHVDYANNVFQSRFYFSKDIVNLLSHQKKKFDIIFCNDPCLSGNFKAFSPQSKLISYQHWQDSFDNKEKKSPKYLTYCYRQAEAAELSDIFLFNSDFAIKNYLKELGGIINNVNSKFIKFPPIAVDYNIVPEHDKVRVLFNHRLSALPQYRQNLENVVDFLNQFDKSKFELYITNPDNKKINTKLQNNTQIVNSSSLEQYIETLKKCNTSLSMFEYSGMWSMSIADSIMSKHNVLFNSHSGYSELLHDDSYSHIHSQEEFKDKFSTLLDNPEEYINENVENYNFANDNYSINTSKNRLKEILENV